MNLQKDHLCAAAVSPHGARTPMQVQWRYVGAVVCFPAAACAGSAWERWPGFATFIHAQVTDVWVQALMKGAAKCTKHCKLRTCVSKVLAECVSACRPCVGQGCLTVAMRAGCWWVGARGWAVCRGGHGVVGQGCVQVGVDARARVCVCACATAMA